MPKPSGRESHRREHDQLTCLRHRALTVLCGFFTTCFAASDAIARALARSEDIAARSAAHRSGLEARGAAWAARDNQNSTRCAARSFRRSRCSDDIDSYSAARIFGGRTGEPPCTDKSCFEHIRPVCELSRAETMTFLGAVDWIAYQSISDMPDSISSAATPAARRHLRCAASLPRPSASFLRGGRSQIRAQAGALGDTPKPSTLGMQVTLSRGHQIGVYACHCRALKCIVARISMQWRAGAHEAHSAAPVKHSTTLSSSSCCHCRNQTQASRVLQHYLVRLRPTTAAQAMRPPCRRQRRLRMTALATPAQTLNLQSCRSATQCERP